MLGESFKSTRDQLALKAVQAIENSEHDTLHAIGTLLPTLNQAQQTVFTTLGEFGDVQRPDVPFYPSTSDHPREFFGVIQHLHEGFSDAQQVLFGQMLQSVAEGNQQQVEHALEHTLRVANAWRTVEEAFAQPGVKKVLESITSVQPSERRSRNAESVWERLGNMLLAPPINIQSDAPAQEQPERSFWKDLNQEMQKYTGKHSYDVLRSARLGKVMTQAEVAQQAGNKSVSYVSAVERGQIKPSLPAAMEFFAATGNNPRTNILPFIWLIKTYEETIFGKTL